MSWIKSDSGLARNPKFFDLVARLKVGTRDGFWHLHHLWYWCSDHHPDGVLKDVSDQVIALSAEWQGDPKVFVDALVVSGFMDRKDGELQLHDWMATWIPDAARLRVRRTSDKRPTFVAAPQYPLRDVVLLFPVAGGGSLKSWELTVQYLEKLNTLYPGVNVLIEAKKALAWLEISPTRRKTAKWMPKFLMGWMERSQNRGTPYGRAKAATDDQEEIKKKLREHDEQADRVVEQYLGKK